MFEGVNLDAAFTIYGNTRTLNLNLATREAMELLPGLDSELIENIIAYREREDIQNRSEIAEIVPFENLQELSPWVGNNTSNIYSIFVYARSEIGDEEFAAMLEADEFSNPDPVTRAYSEIVEVTNYNSLPRVYKIDPYGSLPDTAKAKTREESLLFGL